MSDDAKSPSPALGNGTVAITVANTLRANPYLQVAMAYVHRVGSLAGPITLTIGGIFITLMLLLSLFTDSQYPFILVEMFLCFQVAIYIQEYFSHSRAHFIPNYHRVHGTVAFFMAFLVAVILPALVTLGDGWRSLELIALSLSCLGIILWIIQVRMTWLWPCLMIIVIWGMRFLDTECEALDATGTLQYLAIAGIVFGSAMIISAILHMMRIDKELIDSSEAARPIGKGVDQLNEQEASANSLFDRAIISRMNDRQTVVDIGNAHRAAISEWSKIRRWQVGIPSGLSVLIRGGSLILIWAVFVLILEGGISDFPLLKILMIISAIAPVCAWQTAYLKRTSVRCFEFMLPVSRSEYLNQLGMAVILRQAEIWTAINGALLLFWIVQAPADIPTVLMICLLIISALLQIWLFGIVVLTLLPPIVDITVINVILVLFAAVPVLLAWILARPEAEWQWPSMIVALVFALFGLWITRITYRQWLTVDMD